jgi:chorismate-pyruvate lyase
MTIRYAMDTTANHDQLLDPLTAFAPTGGAGNLRAEPVEGRDMPQPYRDLLVHDHDMTSTLEAHYGRVIRLHVLGRVVHDDVLLRRVVLAAGTDGPPVEYGAIRIVLSCFEGAVREQVREGQRPLGAILAAFNVDYCSRPVGFFAVEPDQDMMADLSMHEPAMLFGRRNVLTAGDGRLIADVVEILASTSSK